MHIHNLSEEQSLLNYFVSQIRDKVIQKDRLRFRRNIERIGEVLGYELSKSLSYTKKSVSTPLGESTLNVFENSIVICSILRAGIPLHNGLLNYFDMAENAFISAYRKHEGSSSNFDIEVKYMASPDLNSKTLILADPMLATGRSLVSTFNALQKCGHPDEVHIVSIIGSKQGVNYIADKFPENTHLWVVAIDDVLDHRGYIVPGLGDAGDLTFGEKLQK